MLSIPPKTSINFLCDAIILPQYYNFECEADFKMDFENFKKISYGCWNLFISAYFLCAMQNVLQTMNEGIYIQLMKKTVACFKYQYQQFDKATKLFLSTFDCENPACFEMGKLLSCNLLQRQEELISLCDINMGCEIADTIYNLTRVIDIKELTDFPAESE